MRSNMIYRAIILTISLALLFGSAQAASVRHTFATQLEEVRTGHFNGKDFLSIQIRGNVGPANCRGNVLTIDVEKFKSENKQHEIENVALSAMLNDDSVLITVPLGYQDCIDGKPTVSDMYLLVNQ